MSVMGKVLEKTMVMNNVSHRQKAGPVLQEMHAQLTMSASCGSEKQ